MHHHHCVASSVPMQSASTQPIPRCTSRNLEGGPSMIPRNRHAGQESPQKSRNNTCWTVRSLYLGRLCSWPSMKEVGRGTLSMKGCHCGCSVQRSMTRAEILALCTAFCKMNGPGEDSYGLFGSGANPRENTRCRPVDRSAMMPSGGGSYRNKFMTLKKKKH